MAKVRGRGKVRVRVRVRVRGKTWGTTRSVRLQSCTGNGEG